MQAAANPASPRLEKLHSNLATNFAPVFFFRKKRREVGAALRREQKKTNTEGESAFLPIVLRYVARGPAEKL